MDVRCYKAPVFSAQTVDYIWDEPQDFVVPVDLGGDGIVSVKIGNERVDDLDQNLPDPTGDDIKRLEARIAALEEKLGEQK